MRARPLRAAQAFGLLAAVGLILAFSACDTSENVAGPATIKVSMLIQSSASEQDARWFRNVEVDKGIDAYELTEKVTEGNLEATYSTPYRSHFVGSILGVENENPRFWLIYVWSEPETKWEPLPVGADLYSVKDGHILAWYYADTTSEGALPTATP